MIDRRYLAGLVALMAVAAWPAWHWVDRFPGGRAGLVAGLVYSAVSLGLGHHWIVRSVSGPVRRFAIALLGGFLARVMGLLAFALAIAYATDANLAVALLTVVGAHLVFGMAEIAYLQRVDALG